MKENNHHVYLKGFVYFATITAFVYFTFFVFINSIQESVFSNKLNPNTQNIVNTIFLEGFGFFTKDPKDEQLELIDTNKNKKIDLNNVSKSNNYGLSRKNRRLLLELGKIQIKFSDSIWIEKRNDSVNLAEIQLTKPFRIKKDKNIKLIPNGHYVLLKYKPIVWEWNHIKNNYNVQYVFFEIY